jgi:hypothetical protein
MILHVRLLSTWSYIRFPFSECYICNFHFCSSLLFIKCNLKTFLCTCSGRSYGYYLWYLVFNIYSFIVSVKITHKCSGDTLDSAMSVADTMVEISCVRSIANNYWPIALLFCRHLLWVKDNNGLLVCLFDFDCQKSLIVYFTDLGGLKSILDHSMHRGRKKRSSKTFLFWKFWCIIGCWHGRICIYLYH